MLNFQLHVLQIHGTFSGSGLQLRRGSSTCPKCHKKQTSAYNYISCYEKTALFQTKRSFNKEININQHHLRG